MQVLILPRLLPGAFTTGAVQRPTTVVAVGAPALKRFGCFIRFYTDFVIFAVFDSGPGTCLCPGDVSLEIANSVLPAISGFPALRRNLPKFIDFINCY